MAFNGSGTFSLYATGNPVVTGTPISSTWANNTLQDIANNGLSYCITKDGQQTVTANLPMAGFKFTGLGAGSASGNSLRYEQVNGVVTTAGDILYATAAGTLARLGIGAANARLHTNAAATAPEWRPPYVSAAQTITAAGALTLAHSLGVTPTLVVARLKCTSTEANYSVNDEVWTPIGSQSSSGADNFGVAVIPDATNLNIRFGSGVSTFLVIDKTTGASASITNNKWNVIFYAWAL